MEEKETLKLISEKTFIPEEVKKVMDENRFKNEMALGIDTAYIDNKEEGFMSVDKIYKMFVDKFLKPTKVIETNDPETYGLSALGKLGGKLGGLKSLYGTPLVYPPAHIHCRSSAFSEKKLNGAKPEYIIVDDLYEPLTEEQMSKKEELERFNRENKKFVLHPGEVISSSDSQVHNINAQTLAKLYGIPMELCIIIDIKNPEVNRGIRIEELTYENGYLHLYPRSSGNYKFKDLEDKLSVILIEKEKLEKAFQSSLEKRKERTIKGLNEDWYEKELYGDFPVLSSEPNQTSTVLIADDNNGIVNIANKIIPYDLARREIRGKKFLVPGEDENGTPSLNHYLTGVSKFNVVEGIRLNEVLIGNSPLSSTLPRTKSIYLKNNLLLSIFWNALNEFNFKKLNSRMFYELYKMAYVKVLPPMVEENTGIIDQRSFLRYFEDYYDYEQNVALSDRFGEVNLLRALTGYNQDYSPATHKISVSFNYNKSYMKSYIESKYENDFNRFAYHIEGSGEYRKVCLEDDLLTEKKSKFITF